jgi:hypothetical protein
MTDDPVILELGKELRQVLIDRGLDPDDPPPGPPPPLEKVYAEYKRRGGTNPDPADVVAKLVEVTKEAGG